MRITKGKKVVIVIMSIVAVFLAYNLLWYFLVYGKYDQYIKGMEEFRPHMSYVLNGEDGYIYNVKYPDYLSHTGNLCVATEDDKYALLIWPSLLGEAEYGIQIADEENDGLYSIMLDSTRKPKEDYEIAIIEENVEVINALYDKADKQWGIYSW